jgi:hypothetical protein
METQHTELETIDTDALKQATGAGNCPLANFVVGAARWLYSPFNDHLTGEA